MLRTKNKFAAGWPWELEIIALCFAVAVIVVPGHLASVQEASLPEVEIAREGEVATREMLNTIEVGQTEIFWPLAVIALYLVHLVLGYRAHRLISTPVSHVVSPIIFSLMFYARLAQKTTITGEPVFPVTPLLVVVWTSVVLLTVFLVVRIRMARYLVRFKDTEWEITRRAWLDRTFFSLLWYLYPLVYLPRQYHAIEEGIVIEGWLYTIGVSYSDLYSIERVAAGAHIPTGTFFATSRNALVRMKLKTLDSPLYISPADETIFIKYARGRIAALKSERANARVIAKAA